MMERMEPFASTLDLQTGVMNPASQVLRRYLSGMSDLYADSSAAQRILAEEGVRLIYEVYVVDVPEAEGQVLHSTTIIYPGRIGQEFHMTKGHFHVKRDRAEIYLGLAGTGALLLQTDDGIVRSVEMRRGAVAYVPPLWAHRTVNTGDAPFAFFAAWPGDAGHDYASIEQQGFAKLLVSQDGRAVLIDNPRAR